MLKFIQRIFTISPLVIYRFIVQSIRSNMGTPHAHAIKSGPLKGIVLWVNLWRDQAFKSMVDGQYDAFIYQDKHVIKAKGQNIWDIGAHIGYHSLGFARVVGNTGKVLAFEPNKANRERLLINFSKNTTLQKSLKLMPFALADKRGIQNFSSTNDIDSAKSSGGYLSSVIPPLGQESYQGFSTYKVKVETIDNIVKKSPQLKPDIIKLDVEGAEAQVLKGGINTLRKYHPYILIEVHNIQAMKEVVEILFKLGYNIKIVNDGELSTSRAFIACE